MVSGSFSSIRRLPAPRKTAAPPCTGPPHMDTGMTDYIRNSQRWHQEQQTLMQRENYIRQRLNSLLGLDTASLPPVTRATP
ncbi:hypothetical protein PG988_011337 [Apiospora saccharicola]